MPNDKPTFFCVESGQIRPYTKVHFRILISKPFPEIVAEISEYPGQVYGLWPAGNANFFETMILQGSVVKVL